MCVSTVQPKITFLENQTASELEEQITLTCEATGDPTPNIIWSFGRRVFTENEQVLRLRDQGSMGKRLGTRGLRLEYATMEQYNGRNLYIFDYYFYHGIEWVFQSLYNQRGNEKKLDLKKKKEWCNGTDCTCSAAFKQG